MGEVIAVLSGKGGTGKTSLCAALGTNLAAAGYRVLCVDADVGLRNLDISLGLSEIPALAFTDVSQEGAPLSQAAQHPQFPTLFFLTAPVGRSQTEIDQQAFLHMTAQARDAFDFCLLDAPAGVGALFTMAAQAASRIILVTGPDPAALRDAARTGELLELMGKREVRLAVNRVSPELYNRMRLTVDDVMDWVGLPLLGVVPEDQNVTLAAARGKPLILYSRRGASAACRRMARRLLGLRAPLQKIKVNT